jgi:UDP-N-acetylglucosamine--N-acetylmuramyl-(pentapeptide) pyrophosphoryl-undecaprenol N-acetylglucosamine transferase
LFCILHFLWQTGKRDYKDVTESLGDRAVGHALFPFADDMAEVYAAADVAVARAGAISLAELEAVGLPALLIPYPHAAGDHQRKNAEDYAGRGCAEVIHEWELEKVDLLQRASSLVESGRAAEMKKSIADVTAGRRPAVDVIAEDIIGLIGTCDGVGGGR